MREIPLTRGYVAIVDDGDYELAMRFKWYPAIEKHTVYAVACLPNPQRTVRLHRLILGLTNPKVLVDHCNHNGLDCRRENLRTVDSKQNARNTRKRLGYTSQFKGVYFDKACQKWRAALRIEGRKVSLGSHTTEQDAAISYNIGARQYFGEYGYQNQL